MSQSKSELSHNRAKKAYHAPPRPPPHRAKKADRAPPSSAKAPYKKKCRFRKKGRCPKGNMCQFAHAKMGGNRRRIRTRRNRTRRNRTRRNRHRHVRRSLKNSRF